MSTNDRTKGVVVPPKDGEFYWTTKPTPKQMCMACGAEFEDKVAVAYYVAKLDDGFQTSLHPGWMRLKWLRLAVCPTCGHSSYFPVSSFWVRSVGKDYGWESRP